MTRQVPSDTVLLTVREVAETMNTCEKTVRRRISSRQLHAYKIGRSVRISLQDLRAYLASAKA